MPTDSNDTRYEQPPVAPAAELYAVPEVSRQIADVQPYEQYSIAAAIHSMFEEAEQGVDEINYWESAYSEQEYPNDTDAFRMYMKEVHRELKQSPAVQELRQAAEAGREITKDVVQAVFLAYERIVASAAGKLRRTLSPEQLSQLKKAGRNNLDWSYRGLLMERLTQSGDVPARYSLEDFFLIINPKARKVQYMKRHEILKSLRYSLSLGNKDRLQNDVRLARQFAHPDMSGETMTDSDLQPFETNPN
ncbi:MAG: hypothetical protein AAB619_04240 [Patescibacteria group bacterium]